MRNKLKGIAALALAAFTVVACLSFAGCKEDENEESEQSRSSDSVQAPQNGTFGVDFEDLIG